MSEREAKVQSPRPKARARPVSHSTESAKNKCNCRASIFRYVGLGRVGLDWIGLGWVGLLVLVVECVSKFSLPGGGFILSLYYSILHRGGGLGYNFTLAGFDLRCGV